MFQTSFGNWFETLATPSWNREHCICFGMFCKPQKSRPKSFFCISETETSGAIQPTLRQHFLQKKKAGAIILCLSLFSSYCVDVLCTLPGATSNYCCGYVLPCRIISKESTAWNRPRRQIEAKWGKRLAAKLNPGKLAQPALLRGFRPFCEDFGGEGALCPYCWKAVGEHSESQLLSNPPPIALNSGQASQLVANVSSKIHIIISFYGELEYLWQVSQVFSGWMETYFEDLLRRAFVSVARW